MIKKFEISLFWIVFSFLILVCVLFGIYLLTPNKDDGHGNERDETDFSNQSQIIEIGRTHNTYDLLIANTYEKRVHGLSYFKNLEADGMLFIFDELDRHGIWMKDMHMNLDIYWLDASKKIIYAQYDVTPKSFPFVFKSEEPALYVIEMPAEKDNLLVGDVVLFK